jgi:hypothetical protein
MMAGAGLPWAGRTEWFVCGRWIVGGFYTRYYAMPFNVIFLKLM